ncbi:hypothetical protein [Streptomyces sp. NPDC020965]|uniref:hypothetical protein n=1 Tax=Streptomyces sp. NPDC020965 TaxID=3365105 RepID=UPI00378A96AB
MPADNTTDNTVDRTVFPLRLAGIAHRVFPAGRSRIDDPFSLRHFTDLTALYGVERRPDAAERGTGNTFATMARALLDDLPPEAHRADIAVVAHATPDLDCRLAAVTSLAAVIEGGPQVFTVTDCGSAAPFAALRVAGEYVRRHGYRRAVVFALDQSTLPYETGRPLAGDAGVALLLTDTGTRGGLTVRRTPGVSVAGMAAAVRAELAVLGADPSLPVVLGPAVEPARDLPRYGGRIVRAAPGGPASGVLAALAMDRWWQAGRAGAAGLVIVDHEPDTGDLSVCLVERNPS